MVYTKSTGTERKKTQRENTRYVYFSPKGSVPMSNGRNVAKRAKKAKGE